MGRSSPFVIATVLCVGSSCTPIDPFMRRSDDGGVGDASLTDAGPVDARLVVDGGADATMPIERGGSYCDQMDDCGACTRCALASRTLCLDEGAACEGDSCDELTACLATCVPMEGPLRCVQACTAGVSLDTIFSHEAIVRCVPCSACALDCASEALACPGA